MPSYRVYLLDDDDHITGSEVIEVDGLGPAVEIATRILQGLPQVSALEIWDGDKQLCALPPSVYVKRARKAARKRRSDRIARDSSAEQVDMQAISARVASACERMRLSQRETVL